MLEATEEFYSLAVQGTGCWGWLGKVDTAGYARLGTARGHRVSYEIVYGPIPEGLVIDHQCRNRSCVNPDHLKAVTRKGNRENLKGAHKNNLSGVRGVHYHKQSGKWRARVGHEGVVIYLGLFDTIEAASKAASDKRIELLENSLIDKEAVVEHRGD